MLKHSKNNELEQICNDWISKNKSLLSEYSNEQKNLKRLFLTFLLNYQTDANWLNNPDYDEYLKLDIDLPNSSNISDNLIPTNELISLNIIRQTTSDDNDEGENENIYINMIVDATNIETYDSLKQITRKYYKLQSYIQDMICYKNFGNLKQYGEDFISFINKKISSFDETINETSINFNVFIVHINEDIKSNLINEIQMDEETSTIKVYHYNDKQLVDIYKRCVNCAWPYVNSREELNIMFDNGNKYTEYIVPNEDNLTGYLVNISAKSIHDLYIRYKEGLFSSNIRYFTKKGKGSKDVNDGIKKSIEDGGEMFFFFNNGITIVTSKLQFTGKSISKIILDKFSIVNGGQTTYLLGRTNFDKDFPIPCKILEVGIDISENLKNKNESQYTKNLNKWFSLTKDISYALNSQKAVSKKDLITNDSRVLQLKDWINKKYYLNKATHSFLITKQGEDGFIIDKTNLVKFENYLAIIFCFFFQKPGFAKNKKSKFYDIGWLEKAIGKKDDSLSFNQFLDSEQLCQVYNAKDKINKNIKKIVLVMNKNINEYNAKQIEQNRLLAHCNNFIMSIIGLTWQWSILPDIQNYKTLDSFHNKKWKYRNTKIFKDDISSIMWTNFINWIKVFIYNSYTQWKSSKTSGEATDYRNFTINDDAYWEYLVEKILTTKQEEWFSKFIDILEGI